MPHWPCEPPKLQLPHELEQLVAMGVRQHGSTDVDFGRQPGIRNDANEYSVPPGHDFHFEPRPRETYRLRSAFSQWLDFLAHLCSCIRSHGNIDMVVWRIDRPRACHVCADACAADSACVAPAHGQRTIRTNRRA